MDPTDQLPAHWDRKDAGRDELYGVIVARPQRRRIGRKVRRWPVIRIPAWCGLTRSWIDRSWWSLDAFAPDRPPIGRDPAVVLMIFLDPIGSDQEINALADGFFEPIDQVVPFGIVIDRVFQSRTCLIYLESVVRINPSDYPGDMSR